MVSLVAISYYTLVYYAITGDYIDAPPNQKNQIRISDQAGNITKPNWRFTPPVSVNSGAIVFDVVSPKIKAVSDYIAWIDFKDGKYLPNESFGIGYFGAVAGIKYFVLPDMLYSCDTLDSYNIPSKFTTQKQYKINFACEFENTNSNNKETAIKIAKMLDNFRGTVKGTPPNISAINIRSTRGESGHFNADDFSIDLGAGQTNVDYKSVIAHEYSHAIDFQRNLTETSWKQTINKAMTPRKTCLSEYKATIDDDYSASQGLGYSCSTKLEMVAVWGEQQNIYPQELLGAVKKIDKIRQPTANSLLCLIKKEFKGPQCR